MTFLEQESDIEFESEQYENIECKRGSSTHMTSHWPPDIDLDVWYYEEREEVEAVIKDANDLSWWVFDSRKDQTEVYIHAKSKELPLVKGRAVTQVNGTVASVMACLRATDNNSFRAFTRMMHPKNFLDSEVIYADQRENANGESLALKWMACTTGKTLGRAKEFLYREYCTIVPDHPTYGTIGVCKFESYDGIGAKYNFRVKPGTYSLAVFEPSNLVVQQTLEEGIIQVTLTFGLRKPKSGNEFNALSPGIRMFGNRFANDLANLQRTLSETLFNPETLVDKSEWIQDEARNNCALCTQSFGMLRRRHHCRVCGEVMCSSCTVFKVLGGEHEAVKIRVCKICLDRATHTNPVNTKKHSQDQHEQQKGDSIPDAKELKRTFLTSCSTNNIVNYSESNTIDKGSNSRGSSRGSTNSSRSSSGPENSTLMSQSTSSFMASYANFDLLAALSISSSTANNSFTGSVLPMMDSSRRPARMTRRIHYFNDELEEMCLLAMETLVCPMASIRTQHFELIHYFENNSEGLPRSLPTFRRMASQGKPCIVLDAAKEQVIPSESKKTIKLPFFVGIPLFLDGEVIGDLCVADIDPRESIEMKEVDVLMVLAQTISQHFNSTEFMSDLVKFKSQPEDPVYKNTTNTIQQSLLPQVSTKEFMF